MSRHPNYRTCIGCNREYERRFFNDAGICTWCRLTHITVLPNPLLQQTGS